MLVFVKDLDTVCDVCLLCSPPLWWSAPHPDWFHLVVGNLPFRLYNSSLLLRLPRFRFLPCILALCLLDFVFLPLILDVTVSFGWNWFGLRPPSHLHEHLWFLHLHFDPKHLLPLVSGTEHHTAELTKSLTSNPSHWCFIIKGYYKSFLPC